MSGLEEIFKDIPEGKHRVFVFDKDKREYFHYRDFECEAVARAEAIVEKFRSDGGIETYIGTSKNRIIYPGTVDIGELLKRPILNP